jgi:hypothetical protein
VDAVRVLDFWRTAWRRGLASPGRLHRGMPVPTNCEFIPSGCGLRKPCHFMRAGNIHGSCRRAGLAAERVPAAPASARGYPRYTAGISEVQRLASFRCFPRCRIPVRHCGNHGSCPPPGESWIQLSAQSEPSSSAVVIIYPYWSRPPGFGVCSVFARMSRYHAVAPVSKRHCALGDCPYLASVLA